MLRESDKFTEALIQIIQSLPDAKRERIARKIAVRAKRKNKTGIKRKRKDSFDEMSKHLDSLGSRLPADYKFNRDEANER